VTIADDTPLRLDSAARLAFPDGSMTASGLRRENRRGRLVIEHIAGKDYTTLAYIKTMREQCRIEAKAPASTSDARVRIGQANTRPYGSSETVASVQHGLPCIRYCRSRESLSQVPRQQTCQSRKRSRKP
jgi:hypothetical protein